MFKKILLGFLFLFAECVKILGFLFILASCEKMNHAAVRIGLDPTWEAINVYGQQNNINGFLEELLQEIAKENEISIIRIRASWDSLYDDLAKQRIHAVISALPTYDFHKGRYDFSQNLIELGAVLIIPINASTKELTNKRIGVLAADQNSTALIKIPQVIMQTYPSVPDLLNAVVRGELDGAVLDRLLGVPYVADLYAGKLKVVESPLTQSGIHFVFLKEENKKLISQFDHILIHLQKNGVLNTLLKKWSLT